MSSNKDLHPIPTITDTEIDRIAAIQDPIIRNLQITQCYHELSAALAERSGLNANWCTFATWASKQAGQTIRKEDLVRSLENVLNTEPTVTQAVRNVVTTTHHIGGKRDLPGIDETVLDILNPFEAIDRASNAVGRGNKKVFEEIGCEFARFFSTCLHSASYDADTITRFCDELRPGNPPDGQRYLTQAFSRYYQSFFEGDAKKRTELILLANIEIGFHEQTRLQPEIAESLNASIIDPAHFMQSLIKAISPSRSWYSRILLTVSQLLGRLKPVDAAIDTLITTARQKARFVITEYLMTLNLPHERLRLGKDLTIGFPESLRELTNTDLRALLDRIDPTPNSLHETGAVDWANLPDRLHFIIDLFRCYQESKDLFDPPFTADQVTAIINGHPPGGRL